MDNVLVSFSGGRTSAFMLKFILEHPNYRHANVLVVFANTGKERPETLDFIHQCDTRWNANVHWIEAEVHHDEKISSTPRLVSYETADREGKVFEEVIKKYGLPSKLHRHCTREMKEYIIHKYAREYFGTKEYFTAIGIRADEMHRVTNREDRLYPLVYDLPVDEAFIRKWWKQQEFDLELKDYMGNCDLCFLKSIRKKKTILSEDPVVGKWWSDMEKKYANTNGGGSQTAIFDEYRQLSVDDLLEASKLPFRKVHDLQDVRDQQGSMFDDEDIEFDCFCKST